MRLRAFFPGQLFDDFWRKLGALALAATVWFWIWTELKDETLDLSDVPVSVQYDEAKLVCLSDPPTVSLALRGNAKRFGQFKRSDVRIKLRVDDSLVHGHSQLPLLITPDQIELPLGISVVEIKPAQVLMEFDQIESREITVRPQWYGLPDDSLVRYMVTPHTVKISGPSQFLSRRPFVQTVPIELKSIPPEGIQTEATIETGPRLRAFPAQVSVVFKGGTQIESRQFNFIPVHALAKPGSPLPSFADNARVTVTVSGPAVVVETLLANDLSAFLDLRKAIPEPGGSRQTLPIQVWIKGNPNGIEIRQVSPPTLDVVFPETAARTAP